MSIFDPVRDKEAVSRLQATSKLNKWSNTEFMSLMFTETLGGLLQ